MAELLLLAVFRSCLHPSPIGHSHIHSCQPWSVGWLNWAISESLEENLCQVLGEDVSNLVLCSAVNHSDLLDLDEVTDSVVPDINVLH